VEGNRIVCKKQQNGLVGRGGGAGREDGKGNGWLKNPSLHGLDYVL
jgi:hypothetical protein